MELVEYIESTAKDINKRTNQLSEIIGMGDIVDLLKYQDLTQGKKIRAVLCVLVSDTLGGSRAAAVDYALAVEMTHQASLVHDDVIDGDMFRRKKLTMSQRHGVGKAILFGDLLISFAVNAIRDMSPVMFYKGGRVMADAWRILSQGAFMEHTMHKNPDENSYVKMAQCKTGILFEASCKLGVTAAEGNEQTMAMFAKYGMCVGTAFQIADDLVDLILSMKKGELVGDLADRRVTLPIIYLKKSVDKLEHRPQVVDKYIDKEELSEDDIGLLFRLVKDAGVIETTQRYVEDLINNAYESIGWLPEGKYKSLLIELPEYAVRALMLEVHQ